MKLRDNGSKVSTLQRILSCLKRTFYIAPDPGSEKGNVLLCEFSPHHICIGLANATALKITQLSYYELQDILEPEKLDDVMRAEKMEVQHMNRVVISSMAKDFVFVPNSHFSEENVRRFFNTAHGGTSGTFFYDLIPDYDLTIVHTLPKAIIGNLKSAQETEVLHFYSSQLRSGTGFKNYNQIAVHFTSKEIYIVAQGEQQVKLAQTYYYSAPLDVVYYLLHICQENNFLQTETILLLSGLVSEDSAMYRELYQYFSNVHFWKPATKTIAQGENPPHFFSSMYNLASCVL